MRISDWSSDVCSSDLAAAWAAVAGPLGEFFRRKGAMLVLLFVLLHKIGDTLANLTFRLLLNDLGFSNTEIATYDVGVGFATMLMGIFVGGILYARIGRKASVLLSLVLVPVSTLSLAVLPYVGHTNPGRAWCSERDGQFVY